MPLFRVVRIIPHREPVRNEHKNGRQQYLASAGIEVAPYEMRLILYLVRGYHLKEEYGSIIPAPWQESNSPLIRGGNA
jgi:hypothetical protein